MPENMGSRCRRLVRSDWMTLTVTLDSTPCCPALSSFPYRSNNLYQSSQLGGWERAPHGADQPAKDAIGLRRWQGVSSEQVVTRNPPLLVAVSIRVSHGIEHRATLLDRKGLQCHQEVGMANCPASGIASRRLEALGSRATATGNHLVE